MRHYRYNWKRSPFDARDHDHEYAVRRVHVPRRMLPAPCIGTAYDQGPEGSCTANALARRIRAMFPGFEPSRQFLYDMERIVEGVALTKDSGAFGRDGAKVLRNTGVCSETTWPYTHADMVHKPSQAAMDEAAKVKITSYQHIYSVEGILDALAAGVQVDGTHEFIPFGFEVPASFEGDEVARTGVMGMPKVGEKFVGGHEVLLCGADLDANVFFVANSWGDPWGMRLKLADGVERGGFFTLPIPFVASRKLCDDFLVLRK